MGKMHQLLAAEQTVNNARDQLLADTRQKFEKSDNFFNGHITRLKMIAESPENEAIERQHSSEKQVITNVHDTLAYMFNFWNKAEDLQFQKNLGNTQGRSHIEFRGETLAEDVPIDEIMGLEVRVKSLRGLILGAPTLDASKKWITDDNRGKGFYRTEEPETATKTQRVVDAKVLVEPTEHHPAQIKEYTRDDVVGYVEKIPLSGAITSRQKAEMVAIADELLVALKEARIRCNDVEAPKVSIGEKIQNVLLSPIA